MLLRNNLEEESRSNSSGNKTILRKNLLSLSEKRSTVDRIWK